MIASGSRKRSGEFTPALRNKEPAPQSPPDVGTLNIKVEKQKDGIAVILPANLFVDTDAVTIHWICYLLRCIRSRQVPQTLSPQDRAANSFTLGPFLDGVGGRVHGCVDEIAGGLALRTGVGVEQHRPGQPVEPAHQ